MNRTSVCSCQGCRRRCGSQSSFVRVAWSGKCKNYWLKGCSQRTWANWGRNLTLWPLWRPRMPTLKSSRESVPWAKAARQSQLVENVGILRVRPSSRSLRNSRSYDPLLLSTLSLLNFINVYFLTSKLVFRDSCYLIHYPCQSIDWLKPYRLPITMSEFQLNFVY